MFLKHRLTTMFALLSSVIALGGEPAPATEADGPFPFLPIWGEAAREKGYELPLPVGLSASFMNIWQDYNINEVQFTPLIPLPFPIEGVEVSRASGKGYSIDGRLDVWLLPFLNLYGIVGYTEGDSTADATVPGLGNLQFPFELDYEGLTYGGGVTLACGYKQFFASLDYNYTRTDLDIADSQITAHVLTPRVGWHGKIAGLKGSGWLGAMYQGIDQEFRGQLAVSVPGLPAPIPVSYAVDEEATNPWNMVFGVEWEISPHWRWLVEGGVIGREQILTSLAFRF
jgi:hypothetical protein